MRARTQDGVPPRGMVAAVVVAVAGLVMGLPARAQDAGQPAASPATDHDTPRYPVSRFVVRYPAENAGLPDPEDVLRSATVHLGIAPGGYIAPREGVAVVELRVGDIADEPMRRFSLSALDAVVKAVFEEFKARGLVGLVVEAEDDIPSPVLRNAETGAYEPDTQDPMFGRDLRPERRPDAQTELHLTVHTGVVTQVRTLASGKRTASGPRLNDPRHDFIREGSPVQPASETGDGPRRDLLRKDLVDAYMQRLNRHPGRRVDAAVSAGEETGQITLDYLVQENKPWAAYFQASNTGTKQTDEWRERFGFSHNQLTGRDDVLSVDYITASFDSANAVLASYEAPLGRSDVTRWRIYGNWSEFTASDVGISNETFEGNGFTLGAELTWNFFQRGEVFGDLVAGARFQNVQVDNFAALTSGDEDFFLPSIGVRLERQTELSSLIASAMIEGNLADVAGTDDQGIADLGRLQVDDNWFVLKFEATHSFFLEPYLNPRFEDPAASPTLAHELALTARAQYAFDYRLAPSFQQVAGGFYSVRGYPESVAAGDTTLVGTIEYRFHIPWARSPGEPGRLFSDSFRYRPQQPYGRADWDLVARAFVDAGWTWNSEKLGFEDDEGLVGVGVGLEFAVKRNLSLRLDWGVALTDTEGGQPLTGGGFAPNVTSGSNQVHLSATILY
ncbi:MAG: ShlB/FhaC/HecB family hemolysin secretion/activation protein [Phycisphaerales bacterium]